MAAILIRSGIQVSSVYHTCAILNSLMTLLPVTKVMACHRTRFSDHDNVNKKTNSVNLYTQVRERERQVRFYLRLFYLHRTSYIHTPGITILFQMNIYSRFESRRNVQILSIHFAGIFPTTRTSSNFRAK